MLLSRLIATKQKLKFVLGLYDLDDSRSLDENEFGSFVTAFIYGMGACFGLRQKDDVMPSTKGIRPLGITCLGPFHHYHIILIKLLYIYILLSS